MADGSVQGLVEERFAPVREQFERNLSSGEDIGACFCATLEGETVVDLWGGYADSARTRPWAEDTIVNVYSTTKTMTALTALLVADRGDLDFNAPVAKYWPEFAANGKSQVKVSHLMSHSAGLSGWKEPITKEDLYDWEKATSLLAAQAPFWEPGTACGYHAVTQGYLVGEVVRRITGKSLGTVFREEFAEPMGADFHIGLPASEDDARRRTDPAAARHGHQRRRAERSRPQHVHQSRHRRFGHRHPGLARRRNSGGGRHGQRPLGRRRSTPSSPMAAWRKASATCPRPAAARRWSSRSAARTDPRHSRPLWHGLWPLRRAHSLPQPQFDVLGRLWRLAGDHRHGCAHHLRLRHEQDGRHDRWRHARLRPRHGDVAGDWPAKPQTTRPGFIRFSGSSARFTARIMSISTADLRHAISSRFSLPTPCSAEIEPFSSVIRSWIACVTFFPSPSR